MLNLWHQRWIEGAKSARPTVSATAVAAPP